LREIRVLLLDLTEIVAGIVGRAISPHDDIEIVGSVSDVRDLELLAEAQQADLVITAYRPEESNLSRFDAVLTSRPGLRVLAIENEGRTACMYALLPQTRELGPLSPKTLIEFIRASAQGQPAWGS
jgi:DNA-binding NarL/FixJ family response regulator